MAGIYIHIPFCIKKCDYCDFISYEDRGRMAEYVDALCAEIRLRGQTLPHRVYETVFIGGGTPTVLKPGMIRKILGSVRDAFQLSVNVEISTESNPGTLEKEKLQEYKEAGINRLSIGLQSADDALLKSIGRIHDLDAFLCGVDLARQSGFLNINADAMHGLPGQTLEQYIGTLRLLAELEVPHISSYALILNEGTRLWADIQAGRKKLPTEDDVADMQDAGIRYLAERGYERYETSNFSKPGFQCRHNINYWENGEYIGIGAAAHSAFNLQRGWTRWENASGLNEYIARLKDGRFPSENIETVGQTEEMFECVMLGLRMSRGIDLSVFYRRFAVDFQAQYRGAIAKLKARQWLRVEDGFARLTEAGMDMQNAAILAFLE